MIIRVSTPRKREGEEGRGGGGEKGEGGGYLWNTPFPLHPTLDQPPALRPISSFFVCWYDDVLRL